VVVEDVRKKKMGNGWINAMENQLGWRIWEEK
jgi:hypothetical protein